MARDSMLMYRSFYESISELPAEQYKHLMTSIAAYSLDGIEPELTGMEKALFILIRPQLDANDNRYQNSLKGGRKKQDQGEKQEETKEEPKENQTGTESETNVSVSLNDSVSVSENENDNPNPEKEPECVFSKTEALNPNKKNSEQLFQQLKTAWNDNCRPKCKINSTLTMTYEERQDWVVAETRIDDPFRACKAIQNYGGICASDVYKPDPGGYSMLGFLLKGVERYADDANPFEKMRIKAGPRVTPAPVDTGEEYDFSQ